MASSEWSEEEIGEKNRYVDDTHFDGAEGESRERKKENFEINKDLAGKRRQSGNHTRNRSDKIVETTRGTSKSMGRLQIPRRKPKSHLRQSSIGIKMFWKEL